MTTSDEDGPVEGEPPDGDRHEPEPADENQTWSPSPVTNYFTRHWRGELSLSTSYWINGVLVSLLANAGMSFIGRSTHAFGGNYQGFFFDLCAWVVNGLLTVWQAVGVWRSAKRVQRTAGNGKVSRWVGLAKVGAVIKVLHFGFAFVTAGTHTIRGAWEQAHFLARQAKCDISVSPDGTELALSGGVGIGFAGALRQALDASPAVRLLHIGSSDGGLLDEAKEAGALIRARGLSTYVSDYCDSACTLVFMGGQRRFLKRGARLGFHAGSLPGANDYLLRVMLDDERRYMMEIGMSADFAFRVAATPSSSMWFPSVNELIAAGIVTEMTDDGELLGPTGAKVAHSQAPRSKRETFLSLLQQGAVSLYIDARRPGVIVPAELLSEKELALQYGYDLTIPIPDLEADEQGVRATLSFSSQPKPTTIPWTAVYMIEGSDGRRRLYADDVPGDVSVTP